MKRALNLNLLLILTSMITLVCCHNDSTPATKQSNLNDIRELLSKADSVSGTSLSAADQKANQALKLSLKTNDSRGIVDSWILIGKILALKGQNNNALDTFSKAFALAEQSKYSKGVCKVKIEIGDVYYTWGKYDQAMSYFFDAKKIAEVEGFLDCQAIVLNYLGKYYHTKGDFEKTSSCYNRSLSLSRSLGDRKQVVMVLLNMGKYYISLGKLSLALEKYLEAFRTCEHLDDKIIYAEVCNHLGGIYLLIDQPVKSLEYHRKALSCRNTLNNPEGIAKSYNNIGKIFLDRKLLDSAFVYFNQSFELCLKTGYLKGTVKALTNLGKLYALQNKPEKQFNVLCQAFDSAYKSGYDVGVAESSLGLGNYFINAQQTDKAIDHYLLSLGKIKKSSLYEIMRDDYAGLFQCYLIKGDNAKALQYHILLSDIEKKLLNVENNRQLAILHISFDSERKEKDNQVLRKDNELKEMTIKRKTTFIWLIIVALAFTILLCILTYRRFYGKQKANRILKDLNFKISKQNSELEKLNKELEKANKEKDILFSIITHELRNPLFWFQNLAEMLSKKYQTMSPDKVRKTLSALDESAKNAFHLMDNLLNWSRSKLKRITPRKGNHSLITLVSGTVKMYETILQQKGIHLFTKVDENAQIFVDPDLFSCVLRNLVTNAIKFTPPEGFIKVECIEDESYFLIMVRDSGKGISGENIRKIFGGTEYFSLPGLMQEKGSGLGLKICLEFVELNNGKIWVSSEPGLGTTFCFTVPKAVPIMDIEMKKDVFETIQEN